MKGEVEVQKQNFDPKKWKVYTWKNWVVLHWILNPGLAINDLILGQKVPKITLEDKTSSKPKIERTFFPCPHCNKIHDARLWSTQNNLAFKNWFGLYCPSCSNIIPCIHNGLSLLILAITFPIWGWFRSDLKKRWLKKQPDRYRDIDDLDFENPFDGKGWLKQGIFFGAFMFLIMSVLVPFFTNQTITFRTLLFGLLVWFIAGIIFGFSMKLVLGKKGTQVETQD